MILRPIPLGTICTGKIKLMAARSLCQCLRFVVLSVSRHPDKTHISHVQGNSNDKPTTNKFCAWQRHVKPIEFSLVVETLCLLVNK